MNRALEPLGEECRSDLDIVAGPGRASGLQGLQSLLGRDEWLRMFVEKSPDLAEHISDFEAFKREGIHRVKLERPIVAFRAQIEDIDNNPFPTPSGKIEIYSQRVADADHPLCPPIPKYMSTPEDRNESPG